MSLNFIESRASIIFFLTLFYFNRAISQHHHQFHQRFKKHWNIWLHCPQQKIHTQLELKSQVCAARRLPTTYHRKLAIAFCYKKEIDNVNIILWHLWNIRPDENDTKKNNSIIISIISQLWFCASFFGVLCILFFKFVFFFLLLNLLLAFVLYLLSKNYHKILVDSNFQNEIHQMFSIFDAGFCFFSFLSIS